MGFLWKQAASAWEVAPNQCSAIPAEFQVVWCASPSPSSSSPQSCHPSALFPKPSQQHPKVLEALGGIHPPLSPAGPALPGGISSSCHCSRSIPLIAVSYSGVNGDVLCASTEGEAARRNVPAELSWEREMGEWMEAQQGQWRHPGSVWAGKLSQPRWGWAGNGISAPKMRSHSRWAVEGSVTFPAALLPQNPNSRMAPASRDERTPPQPCWEHLQALRDVSRCAGHQGGKG